MTQFAAVALVTFTVLLALSPTLASVWAGLVSVGFLAWRVALLC